VQPPTLAARIGDTSYRAETGPDAAIRVATVAPAGDDAARPATEAAFEVHDLGQGRVRLLTPERSVLAFVVEDGEARWVWLEGRVFRVDVEHAERRPRRSRAAGPDALSAPMPATVIRVVAGPGTRVARGETLVILEAMKMELPLRAPHDAVVAAVHCAEGDLVQPGVVLVSLELPED
jgi:biotin carboxyl carrier protein